MSWIIKHKKTKKIMEFNDGDIVEVIANGEWRAGEVTHYKDADGITHFYVSIFGYNPTTANIDDPTLRQGSHANREAQKHYEEQIQIIKDEIAHKSEKDDIKELQSKIAKLNRGRPSNRQDRE